MTGPRYGAEWPDEKIGGLWRRPLGVVHRESNPGREDAATVMTKAGQGASMYEVDGPGDP
jgi:hypothetical protein